MKIEILIYPTSNGFQKNIYIATYKYLHQNFVLHINYPKFYMHELKKENARCLLVKI